LFAYRPVPAEAIVELRWVAGEIDFDYDIATGICRCSGGSFLIPKRRQTV